MASPNCIDCGRFMSSDRPRVPAGATRYGAYGRCQACDKRLRRGGTVPAVGAIKRAPVRARATDRWPGRP